ncbi:MAG TPA: hypothetical protein VFC03_08525 [Acidimicrobiales bacterium]|jgi:hypothetical protein|nr:hypothetical protein [Acidimicrobiales bacterium]
MAHSLEAPGTDEAPEFSSLYRARGDEVVAQRPVFTGDVFFGVSVIGEDEPKDVLVLQHPCVIRRGLVLTPKLLVAEVRPEGLHRPSKWDRFPRQMPLAELVVEGTPTHYAAFFVDHQLVRPESLDIDQRVACMSQRGVNLLMQRWVHHNSRVIVPTYDYQDVTSPQYEESDIIEEWCIDREDDGVSLDDATVEIDAWLTGDKSPTSPRARLEDPQQRSAIRREVRAHLRTVRS